jgi:hypothetical protein
MVVAFKLGRTHAVPVLGRVCEATLVFFQVAAVTNDRL